MQDNVRFQFKKIKIYTELWKRYGDQKLNELVTIIEIMLIMKRERYIFTKFLLGRRK